MDAKVSSKCSTFASSNVTHRVSSNPALTIRTLTMVLVRLRTPHDGQPLGDVQAQARRSTGLVVLY